MADDGAGEFQRFADMAQILSAITTALVEADAMSADRLRDFIETVGFEPYDPEEEEALEAGGVADDPAPLKADATEGEKRDHETDRLTAKAQAEAVKSALGKPHERLGRLRCISFSYDKMSRGEPVKTVVRIPLLALIPLPALQIQEAEFEMDLEVNTLTTADQGPPRLSGAQAKASSPRGAHRPVSPVRLRTAVAPSGDDKAHRRTKSSARMHVTVRMESADMPVGLQNLMSFLDSGTGGASLPRPRKAKPDEADTDQTGE